MTNDHIHGHTGSGAPITDSEIEALADEAEAGYDIDRLIERRCKRGRPPLGSAPAGVFAPSVGTPTPLSVTVTSLEAQEDDEGERRGSRPEIIIRVSGVRVPPPASRSARKKTWKSGVSILTLAAATGLIGTEWVPIFEHLGAS
jgi:hypothetical protein